MTSDADVTIEAMLRSRDGDRPIFRVRHRYEHVEDSYNAVRFDHDVEAAAPPASPGDRLVLKLTVDSSEGTFIPNGDGARAAGRIPSLTLPR